MSRLYQLCLGSSTLTLGGISLDTNKYNLPWEDVATIQEHCATWHKDYVRLTVEFYVKLTLSQVLNNPVLSVRFKTQYRTDVYGYRIAGKGSPILKDLLSLSDVMNGDSVVIPSLPLQGNRDDVEVTANLDNLSYPTYSLYFLPNAFETSNLLALYDNAYLVAIEEQVNG